MLNDFAPVLNAQFRLQRKLRLQEWLSGSAISAGLGTVLLPRLLPRPLRTGSFYWKQRADAARRAPELADECRA